MLKMLVAAFYRCGSAVLTGNPLGRRLLYGRITGSIYEKLGFHIVPNHFYHPIPDSRDLQRHDKKFDISTELVGLDMRLPDQLRWLREILVPRFAECDFPREKPADGRGYYIRNGSYGRLSASILYAMVRHFGSKRIIEVGSGISTRVTAHACERNNREGKPVEFIAIEPFPPEGLQNTLPGLSRLVQQKVEDVPMELFTSLEAGDILFIDSSHVVKSFGDVNFLYLEVLPRLQVGVIVHIHDIFFPREYPRDWVVTRRWFWTEQYLLQAFLMFNSSFEVCISESYLRDKAGQELEKIVPFSLGFEDNFDSSSLWMRRIR